MTSLRTLIFYATPEHPCSYLEDKQAITMFVDPKAEVTANLYKQLTQLGFRRSGSHYYRPHCNNCNACIPVRIPVNAFRPTRSQKRTARRNEDLAVICRSPCFNEEHYQLYKKYINNRHQDGDMYPATMEQFQSFLVEGREETRFYEFRKNDQLVAVAVTDHLEDSLSAIYTFFDPDMEERGLGVNSILWQIEEAQRLGLEHLYLGYWIRNCQKMAYKIKYRPTEMLLQGSWVAI